jgi:hypothetical protein
MAPHDGDHQTTPDLKLCCRKVREVGVWEITYKPSLQWTSRRLIEKLKGGLLPFGGHVSDKAINRKTGGAGFWETKPLRTICL